jgi:O-antigen/teichoic acid export membrane protein
MAIASVVIGFSDIFIDIGVSNAIIYKKEISREKLSTLYWINILVGIIFFAIITLISSPLAIFYESIDLKPVLMLIAATFLIKPWGQQHMILLQKNLRFNTISIIETFARIFSFILTIYTAYIGLGVYSLVVGLITFSLFSTMGFILRGLPEARPKFYFNIFEIKDELNFGLYQLGEKSLNYFSSQFDSILIGKLINMEVLGIYSMAKSFAGKLFYFVIPIVSKVTYPIMANMNGDLNRLKNYHLFKITAIAYITFPIYTYLALASDGIIYLFFGPKWGDSSLVFAIVSLSYIVLSIINPIGALLLSLGKAKTSFYWNLFTLIVNPIAILIGSHYGLFGIIYASFFMVVINYFISLQFFIKPVSGLDILINLKAIKKPFLFSILTAIISFSFNYLLPLDKLQIYLSLIIYGFSFFIPFFILIFIFDKGIIEKVSVIIKKN